MIHNVNFCQIPSRLRSAVSMLAIVLLLMGTDGCSGISQIKTLKLSHGLNTEHPVHHGIVHLGEVLEEVSNGQMRIEIYPNQQLGTERQALELLQIGGLDMTKVSAAVMENFSPDMRVLGLPYIFENRAHAYRVLDDKIGKRLLAGGEKYMLKGLGYYDAGFRSFYTKQPIEEASDLAGLKIRVMQSVTAIKTVRSMGGSATPMSFGELYSALQQGIVDGAENNPPTFLTTRHYEVCKYYTLDEHTSLPDILIMGTPTYKSLNHQQKEWLKYAVDSSVEFQRELWQQKEFEALEELKEAGVTIIKPDKDTFRSSVETVYDDYEKDQDIMYLVQEIRKLSQ